MSAPQFFDTPDGQRLAVRATQGAAPALVFLPGFNSDMEGEKATRVAAWCAARGRGCVRFDYSGHGLSEGRFADGTISRWRDDALAVIDWATRGAVVLVGSSMGGWIALLAALARPTRVVGVVGIAPAPDFTEDLIWDAMTQIERQTLLTVGTLSVPSDYGAPVAITRALIEDGRRHLLLRAPIPLAIPVRLLHGQQDTDVPWERSQTLAGLITSPDVHVTLIKDGTHRLSRPGDLDSLEANLAGVEVGLRGYEGRASASPHLPYLRSPLSSSASIARSPSR